MSDFEEEKLTPEQIAELEAIAKMPQPERTEAERLACFKDDNPYMHIHAQDQWHSEAFIVANEQALLLLKKAIEDALVTGHGYVPSFAGDGEGYNTLIAKVDKPESFDRMALGYTDEVAGKHQPENAIWPWDMKRIHEAQEDSTAWIEKKYNKEEADEIKQVIAEEREERKKK